ncbi:MAG: uncharacterized protein KVP18_005135, partial [Porospora cf. gigantea A]|uniref:uncharacterized protein n=1 Tax=Porospora cf. gigantea A TaxID=2853593 RepID=UPI0035593AF2
MPRHNRVPRLTNGDPMPRVRVALKGETVDLRAHLKNRRGIVLGLEGAFLKETTRILTDLLQLSSVLSSHAEFIACTVVNDPEVLRSWGSSLGAGTRVTFISDFEGDLARSFGYQVDLRGQNLGLRCRRFVMIVEHSCIRRVWFDQDVEMAKVLEYLTGPSQEAPMPVVSMSPAAPFRERARAMSVSESAVLKGKTASSAETT